MSMVLVHALRPCQCCVSLCMLDLHVLYKSKLHVNVHAACPCPWCMPISMLHVHVHGAFPFPCCMSMSMLHVHVHAACPCPCCMSMSMMHVHVQAVSPCPCCMSMSLFKPFVRVGVCLCVFVCVCINAGMPDCPASVLSGTGMKKN
jgi:hypothetical protein